MKSMIYIVIAALCLAQSAYADTDKSHAITPAIQATNTTKTTVTKSNKPSKQNKKKKHITHKKSLHHKHHKSKHKKKVIREEDDATDDKPVTESENKAPPAAVIEAPKEAEATPGFVSNFQHHLVNYVYETIDSLTRNSYKLGGTRFDSQHGVYKLDCSSYVDHLLEQASPNAYFTLVDTTGADKPTTQHYYDFFTDLADRNSNYWNKVDEVDQLRAGDILVFRYKNSHGYQTGGHIVVVMDKPIRDTNVFFLRVADSARSRHSQDTRHRHESGIGIGTMLLKVNPKTGQPSAFAWGVGSYWNKNVTFAMARPLRG